jgi:hypothetical protein
MGFSAMRQALRCHARSKRTGLQCQAPAAKGQKVCRMHGAGGGAPKGNRKAWKHGLYSAETLALGRLVNGKVTWQVRHVNGCLMPAAAIQVYFEFENSSLRWRSLKGKPKYMASNDAKAEILI